MAKKSGVNNGTTAKLNIDVLCDMIIDGKTFRDMAAHYDCSISIIHRYLIKGEHSARAKEALEISANQYANKGEEALIVAKSSLTEIQRARELAQHYRWMASKRSPKVYGDSLKLQGDKENPVQVQISGMEIK